MVARVNPADKRGFTLLHGASAYGHEAIVRVLLDHGANVQDTSRPLLWRAGRLPEL